MQVCQPRAIASNTVATRWIRWLDGPDSGRGAESAGIHLPLQFAREGIRARGWPVQLVLPVGPAGQVAATGGAEAAATSGLWAGAHVPVAAVQRQEVVKNSK